MSIVGNTYLERGQPVTIVAQWSGKGPHNVMIERADGSRVVRPFRGLRKPRPTAMDHLLEALNPMNAFVHPETP